MEEHDAIGVLLQEDMEVADREEQTEIVLVVLAVEAEEVVGLAVAAVGEVGVDDREVDKGIEVAVSVGAVVVDKEVRVEEVIVAAEV